MDTMAIKLGASFVGRSFSGDKEQLVPLIKAAIEHRGAAFLDVISPCVAFNNHAGSTKSYDWVREHNEAVNQLDVMPEREEMVLQQAPGTVEDLAQHDGSVLRLRKLAADFDPTDRAHALDYLERHAAKGELVTGLLFIDREPKDLHDHLSTVPVPLNTLDEKQLCPGSATLAAINAALR
jgi:2-oxoglutarate ferredoxin oxidoreductase subunit beta